MIAKKGLHMIRTKTTFLVVAIFAFAITVQEGNSASFNATGAVREGAAGANLLQKGRWLSY